LGESIIAASLNAVYHVTNRFSNSYDDTKYVIDCVENARHAVAIEEHVGNLLVVFDIEYAVSQFTIGKAPGFDGITKETSFHFFSFKTIVKSYHL